ncbi:MULTISPECIES: hypothetical protein [Paenibacillus]|uniref:hypothetical protein n=1 Tax=Paenibacillus TaxID=44249 RepID=UPI0022B9097A|nr:hypothetical protein [Paenibacillus caseinilyticus]MCZ8518187.1 hypothetical protein [Paenibacillus caseinilyticus]
MAEELDKIKALEKQMKLLCGRKVEARIEDMTGSDALAPPHTFELVRAVLVPEGTHLKCYMNLSQHLSIPVFADERTRVDTDEQGAARLVSVDPEAGLRYKLRWL